MVRYVIENDLPDCLILMELVKDDFPGYKEKEFLEALYRSIERHEAILDEKDGVVTGLLMCSHEDNELTFLATHPEYRKKGIANDLIRNMKADFSKGDTIYVTTFREGDLKGVAARACYHSCGFVDREELEVFNYPCQKMALVI